MRPDAPLPGGRSFGPVLSVPHAHISGSRASARSPRVRRSWVMTLTFPPHPSASRIAVRSVAGSPPRVSRRSRPHRRLETRSQSGAGPVARIADAPERMLQSSDRRVRPSFRRASPSLSSATSMGPPARHDLGTTPDRDLGVPAGAGRRRPSPTRRSRSRRAAPPPPRRVKAARRPTSSHDLSKTSGARATEGQAPTVLLRACAVDVSASGASVGVRTTGGHDGEEGGHGPGPGT